MHDISWEFGCVILRESDRIPSSVVPPRPAVRAGGASRELLILPSGHAAGLNDGFDLTHIY